MPSPVKLRSNIPYCKTYEQIRLEEIQAESAAYYSYETNEKATDLKLHQKQTNLDQAKGIYNHHSNERIYVNPSMFTPKNASKELNFKVLTLEEIRQQKQQRELAVKTKSTTATPITTVSIAIGVKRRSNELCNEKSIGDESVKVPPVKLRRSLKSIVAKKFEISQPDEKVKMAGQERLEGYYDGSINVNRRSDVEIRTCDSSTTEQKIESEATEDKKSVYMSTEDTINSVLLDVQPFNSDEEYLKVDTSSADDIMKDIEDLLK